jgi:UPF0271 protein
MVGNDEEVMPHITSANVACGFHAGDPVTMANTIELAKKNMVAIGAHPSYPDLMGFGRREMRLTLEELTDCVIYQIGALQGFATASGVSLQHVKAHGALYNTAAEDEETSRAIAHAVKAVDDDLIVFAPPKSVLARVAASVGLRVAHEFFADRAYNVDGSLVPRKLPNSVVEDPVKVVERVVNCVKKKQVLSSSGEVVVLGDVETVCVHGDTPGAAKLVEAIRKALIEVDVEVKSVRDFV